MLGGNDCLGEPFDPLGDGTAKVCDESRFTGVPIPHPGTARQKLFSANLA